MSLSDQKPVILYIGGAGRSGSTLLEMMIGEMHGFLRAGELTYIWERGFLENQLCGCGRPFRECPFWGDVLASSFGDLTEAEVRDIQKAKEKCCRLWSIPGIVNPEISGRTAKVKMNTYRSALTRLYAGLWEIGGGRCIIDSSKYPAEAFLLSGLTGVEVRYIHLVRDPRGVAFSWQRRKKRPEIHWRRALMPRYPVAVTAVAWRVYNRLFEWIGAKSPEAYLRVQYEEMITEPERVMRRIALFVGFNCDSRNYISDGKINFTTNHSVSGNPIRFKTGAVTLRNDDVWREKMRWWKRMLVSMLAGGMMNRYGYSRAPERHAHTSTRRKDPVRMEG